jgi:hypothetical protein
MSAGLLQPSRKTSLKSGAADQASAPFLRRGAARFEPCMSVRACTVGAGSAARAAPGFCPNADILFEFELEGQTVSRSTAKH